MSNGEAELLVTNAPQFTAYLQTNRVKLIEKIKLAGDVAFANSLKSWHLSSLPISSGYHAYEWRSKHEPADIGEPAHLTALPQ